MESGGDPEAERVAGRIEAHPHVRLRLEVGHPRAARHRVRHGRVQVVDPDLEVHLHLLVARSGRPDWWHMPLFGLGKVNGYVPAVGRLQHAKDRVGADAR